MANERLQKGFGLVSNDVMRDPNIPLKLKGLYSLLATYADKDNGETFISVNRMAAETNIDDSSVRRYLTDLIKLGVISRTRRGKNQSWITRLLK